MSEAVYIRACDLRPGDVVAPDDTVVRVQGFGFSLGVVTQRPGEEPRLGVCLADQWLCLAQEGA